jgi:hypothetical protein
MKLKITVILFFITSMIYSESPWDWGWPSSKENSAFIILFNLEKQIKNEMNKESVKYWIEEHRIPTSTTSDIFLVERVTRTIVINRIISENSYDTPIVKNEPIAEIFIIDGDSAYSNSNILYISKSYKIKGNVLQIGMLYSDETIFHIIRKIIEDTNWESFTTWSYN